MEFRHLRLDDVKQLLQWGVHDDARLYHYGFNYKDKKLQKDWYYSKYIPFRKYIYGGFIEKELVGYITLKEIKWFRRKAMMGVAIDIDKVNKGYGQALINHYLQHVFTKTPLKAIELWVATFNTRAIRCYEKSGFTIVKSVEKLYEEQSLGYEILTTYPEVITKTSNRGIYMMYHLMRIEKRDFKKHLL